MAAASSRENRNGGIGGAASLPSGFLPVVKNVTACSSLKRAKPAIGGAYSAQFGIGTSG